MSSLFKNLRATRTSPLLPSRHVVGLGLTLVSERLIVSISIPKESAVRPAASSSYIMQKGGCHRGR